MFVFLARLVLILIAVSVVRSVVKMISSFWAGLGSSSARPSASGPTTTALQQDPVCGTYVAVDTSLKRLVNGKVVHFCSAECRDSFQA